MRILMTVLVCAGLVAVTSTSARADDYLNELERGRDRNVPRPSPVDSVFEGQKNAILQSTNKSDQGRVLKELQEIERRLACCEAEAKRGPESGFGGALRRLGFTLRRGFSEPADKEGAAIVYTRDIKADDDTATVEGCLKWKKDPYSPWDERWRIGPVVALMGNLTTDNPDDTNYWSLVGGLSIDYDRAGSAGWRQATAGTMRLYTHTMLRYDRSQDDSIEKLFGSLEASPIYGRWALGVRRGFGPCRTYTRLECDACVSEPGNALSFQWDLTGRVDAGSVLEAGAGIEQDELLFATQFALRGHLYLDFLGHALGWPADSTIYPLLGVEYVGRYMPDQPTDYVDTFSAWFKLPLTKFTSLQLSYIEGAEGASLDDVERVELALTFGF